MRAMKSLSLVLLLSLFVSASLFAQYSSEKQSDQEKYIANITSHAQSAVYAVALAEEAYYTINSQYTSDYNELKKVAKLVIDPILKYGTIMLYNDSCNNFPSFRFSVTHPFSTIAFIYDSGSVEIMQKVEYFQP